MAGKRPEKKKSKIAKTNGNEVSSDFESDRVGQHPEPIDIDTPTPPPVVSAPPEDPRTRLRARWELASVLNFLRVFKPIIKSKLEISANEIETALINPNQDLSELHISLLKGIPPVSKNLVGPDAWVTVLNKKLAPWWPWVAEGEIPLKASHGEEIPIYKKLDPVNRLVILKSLCEVRALQDDFVSYISDALKQGTDIRTFRKERICGDSAGIAYWNDGDEVLGYRLYREVTKVDYTPRKVKGRLTEPPNGYQWETLATNLEEFQEISDKFSSSEIVAEATVGEIVKNEMIPILEEIQKKKERALKRQQKQVTLLNGYLNSHPLGATRSCRSRKPVKYTFDEYDKTIEEAIQLTKKRKTDQEPKQGKKSGRDEGGKHVNANGNSIDNVMEEDSDEDDDKFRGGGGGGSESDRGDDDNSESDRGDKDYEDKSYGESENDKDDHDSETEEEDHDNGSDEEDHDTETDEEDQDNERKSRRTRANGHSLQINSNITRDVANGRRSKRVTGNGNHRVKMQKHSSDTSDSDPEAISDSDDGSSSESPTDNTPGAEKESLDVLDGLLEESEENENESEEDENDSDE